MAQKGLIIYTITEQTIEDIHPYVHELDILLRLLTGTWYPHAAEFVQPMGLDSSKKPKEEVWRL